jgi:hypothetical protein
MIYVDFIIKRLALLRRGGLGVIPHCLKLIISSYILALSFRRSLIFIFISVEFYFRAQVTFLTSKVI